MARLARRRRRAEEGQVRGRFLLAKLLERAHQTGLGVPATVTTPYVNTIPTEEEPPYPGDEHIERRIRRFIRWNAAVMVIKANHLEKGIGGHLSTFASSATLYEVGFNHFWRGKEDGNPGDHIYIQGHATPGIYARAFLERRLDEEPSRPLPVRGRWRRAVLLPPPPAHARLLGIPDGVDGAGTDQLDLPGPLQQVPPQPRAGRHLRVPGVVLHR